MLTIAISPQLHHAVKWTKVQNDVSSVVISPSESKALKSIFNRGNDSKKQEGISRTWE